MAFHFEFLADRPEATSVVAQWYYDQWGNEMPDETVKSIEAKLAKFLNRDAAPLIVLAVDDRGVVGTAELKFREMDIYPEREHWLGGVFVDPEYRGGGIGSALAEKVAEIALSLDVRNLSLQTERSDGGLYRRLGWEPVERVYHHGRNVLVMERWLGS